MKPKTFDGTEEWSSNATSTPIADMKGIQQMRVGKAAADLVEAALTGAVAIYPINYIPSPLPLELQKFHTTSDTVLIRQDLAPEFTDSGIALPEPARRQPPIGRVVAVGPGRAERKGRTTRYTSDVRVGDRVFYHEVAAKEVTIEGETLVHVEAPNVLGVIE